MSIQLSFTVIKCLLTVNSKLIQCQFNPHPMKINYSILIQCSFSICNQCLFTVNSTINKCQQCQISAYSMLIQCSFNVNLTLIQYQSNPHSMSIQPSFNANCFNIQCQFSACSMSTQLSFNVNSTLIQCQFTPHSIPLLIQCQFKARKHAKQPVSRSTRFVRLSVRSPSWISWALV